MKKHTHNTNGTGQSWAVPSYQSCAHCRVNGNGTIHTTVSCTCGAKGVFCYKYNRCDWGEFKNGRKPERGE